MGRLALLIANDSFLDENLHPLVAPRADARSLRKLLLDEEIGGFDSAAMLVNESKPEIERSIERVLGQAGPEDLVCLYFSGHGLRDGQGDLYFAVANTEQDLLRSTAVSASFLLNLMEHSQAASVVLLLDCCFSGALIKGFKGSTELREVLAVGRGRFVLTASNQIELARDGRIGADGNAGHSAFTGVIVEGLRTGKADVDNDGLITPENLWTYVSREMRDKAPRQTPKKFGEVSQETHLARVSTGLHTALDSGMRVHLGDLLGRRSQTADQGYRAEEFPGLGKLIVPIGQVIEAGQRKNRVLLNLGRDHLLIVGRIGCGKSTLLRTLACGLSLTHTPDEARLVFLESGGAKLGSLRRLPHVASYVTNRDAAMVTSLLGRLEDVIGQRNDLFVQHYTANVAEFRDARERWDSGHSDYPHPTVFVFVDRWADFAATVPGFADRMAALASAGLDVGVHVVISARSWGEVPRPVEELVSRRIEFGLAEAGTTRFDGAVAATLAAEPAGWAQTKANRLRVALPSLEPVAEVSGSLDGALSDGAPELVEHVLRSNADSGAVTWRDWRVLRLEPAAPAGTAISGDTSDVGSPTAAPKPASGTGGTPPAVDAAVGESPPTKDAAAVEPPGTEPPETRPESDDATTTEPAELAARLAGAAVTGSAAVKWVDTLDQFDGRPNPLTVPPHLGLLLGLPEEFTATDLETLRNDGDDGTIPFGIDAYGNQVVIPFSRGVDSPARPAGLVVGGDMSGKNELMRTLLISAVARHPVDRLNLALSSFRSRNVFKSLGELPHQVAVAERLVDRPAHARRYAKLLENELRSRAQMLADKEQRPARAGATSGAGPARLPTLLVVIDEFADLIALEPEFGNVIQQICREGNSLGMRLLLSARSLRTENVADIDQYLGYRVAMRCDAASSRAVIGHAYAAELPESPGSGFLRVGGLPAVRFGNAPTFQVADNGMTLAQHVIELANDLERPTESRWPEPMARQPDLSELLPIERDPARGLGAHSAPHQLLKVPIGLIEHAETFRARPLIVDFTGQDEHGGSLLVTGAHKSGKPHVAVTASVALALTHTPEELHTYILSPYEHSRLEYLARLPHVGGSAIGRVPAKVRRMVHELYTLVQKRQRLLAGGWNGNFENYLQHRALGSVIDRYARVLLILRGWNHFTELFPELVTMALDIARSGPVCGVHSIITSSGDVTELLDRENSIPHRRLITIDDTGFDGERDHPDITATGKCHGVDENGAEFTGAYAEPLIEQITHAWHGDRAPAIPDQPTEVTVGSLPPALGPTGLSIPIGIDADTLGPAFIDFADTPHLLLSSHGSNKNRFLVALVQLLMRQRPRNRAVTVFTRDSELAEETRSIPGVETSRIPRGIHVAPALQQIRHRQLWPHLRLDLSPSEQAQLGSVQEFVVVDHFGSTRFIPELINALWNPAEISAPNDVNLIVAYSADHGIPATVAETIGTARPSQLLFHDPAIGQANLIQPRGERTVLLAQPGNGSRLMAD